MNRGTIVIIIAFLAGTFSVHGQFVAVILDSFRRGHLSFQVDLAYASKGSKTTKNPLLITTVIK